MLKRTSQDVQLAYCWAHARRKLHEVAKASAAPIAQEDLKQIAVFYRIEADIKGDPAKTGLAARIERMKPKLLAFEIDFRTITLIECRPSTFAHLICYVMT